MNLAILPLIQDATAPAVLMGAPVQMAEVAVPGGLFREILRRIDQLRRPVPAMA